MTRNPGTDALVDVSALASASAAEQASTSRQKFVDVFRGLLIAHMALDHASLMFNAGRGPEELAAAAPATEPVPPAGAGSITVELAAVRRVLAEVLDGSAGVPKLTRLLDDEALAKRLAELAGEHQRFKDVLMRIGLLPRASA